MTIRILQLACYQGNIGDNANIIGIRTLLNQNLKDNIEYTNLDILDFLWGNKLYDDQFLDLVNQHDLLIIGGGGYFELTVDHTCSGTPIDIEIDILKQIKIPVVFYALGVDVARGVPALRLKKFKTYLEYLMSSENILISVRNDGAMNNIKQLFGDQFLDQIYKVPDGGFFTQVKDHHHPEMPEGGHVIGINLAGDMPHIRFQKAKWGHQDKIHKLLNKIKVSHCFSQSKISRDQFLIEFSAIMRNLLESRDDLHLILFPHIYKDIKILADFIFRMPSEMARRRITMAPYLSGYGAQEYIFDLYRKCDIVMGMRFHTNVCGIGLGVPTIGFISYPQIEALYNELGIEDRALKISQKGFGKRLENLINETLSKKEQIKEKYREIRQHLVEETNSFHKIIWKMLNKN